jgi:hypothetical protein
VLEQRISQFVARSSPGSDKVTSVPHYKDVETEKALSSWVEDMRKRNVSIRRTEINKKALSVYEQFRKVGGDEGRQ